MGTVFVFPGSRVGRFQKFFGFNPGLVPELKEAGLKIVQRRLGVLEEQLKTIEELKRQLLTMPKDDAKQLDVANERFRRLERKQTEIEKEIETARAVAREMGFYL